MLLCRVHGLAASLLLLHVLDVLVNDAWPCRILAPPAQALVRQRLFGKAECLVPHVFVDTLLPPLLEELDPPVKPWRAAGRPF